MDKLRILIMLIVWAFVVFNGRMQMHCMVVADSITRCPLPNASVFNKTGTFIGTGKSNGNITCAAPSDYPITIRYMGYNEITVPYESMDTIFLKENISELPEVIVEAKQKMFLHILAYVREYSTLLSYTDTITMFREKMVDFMLPNDDKSRFKGWRNPRVLNSRSYYHFTNAFGLDSVSDRCNQHFTWSDWIGIFPKAHVPDKIMGVENGVDTVFGKYSPTEIWLKNAGRLTLDIDVLADTTRRKWVPNISSFFKKDGTDFERFRIKLNYNNFLETEIGPVNLSGYSFNIESRGRGRGMFMFGHYDQPFFVTTYTEVYILDREFISLKEAKQWDKRKFLADEIEIFEPMEAPELHHSILAIIDRVNRIDSDQVRLSLEPDYRLMSRNVSKRNFGIGYRALSMLKQLTGISYYKSHKNFNRRWNEFRDNWKNRDSKRDKD